MHQEKEEEEIDIDQDDPEVNEAATKIQASFNLFSPFTTARIRFSEFCQVEFESKKNTHIGI